MVRFSSTNNPLPTLPLGMFYAPGRIQIDVDGQFTNEVYIKFGNHWTAPAIQSAVPSASGEQVDIVVEHDLATLAEPIVTIGHAPVRILGQTALPRTATRFRTLLTVETPATSGQLAIEVREGLGPRSNALRVDIASSAASLQPAVTCVGMPVTITGARFGYDPNRVVASIGGIVQPVTQAAGGQMMFLVQDGTSTGPLQISIDGIPSEGAPVLTVAPDNDRDGMPDAWELTHGLATDDPRDALQDLDGDGLDNRREYQLRTNPRQTDSDAGGLADGLEVDLRLDPLDPTDDAGDPDHDNLPTPLESTLGTDPTRADTDNDGLGDGQEHLASLGFATSPLDPDTDDDGLTDGAEVLQYRTNPLIADTDGDGLSDGDEIAGTLGEASNPLLRDSDGDGLDDRVELETHRTSPTRADTDGDGLLDRAEIEQYLTDPRSADTDGDTLEDGLEVALGLDPRTATPTTTVIGRVQLPDGAPAAGVDVTLDGISSSLYATTTDAAGAFLLTRCPALSASPAGPRNTSVTASIRRPGGGGCFSARSPVRVAVAGGTTDLGIVRLATAPDQPLFPITAITPQLFGPFQILPVDLDVDGAQDLVAVAHATGGASNVSLHPGRGCGLYGPERLLPLGHAFQVTGPALQADLEGDGLPELLVPHAQGFTVFPNRRSAQSGLPVLGEAVQVSMTVPANALVALDVDLDQDLDLVAFTNANGTMRVIRNQGALALVPQPGQTLGFAPGLAVTGDFDRDGGVDIVVSEEPTGAVRFLRNAGDGSFAVVATHMAGSRAGRLRATDLDANGELDVLCHDYLGDQMAVLLNRGGVMTRSTFATPQNAIDFDIADLDGDGDIDLVFGDVGTSGLPPGLQVFRNNGLGGFAQPVASPLIDMPETLVLTDADGDGNADAIVGAGLVPSSNPLPPKLFGVHRGFGDGTFEVEQTYEHDALSPWRPRVAMGDVTGDGRPDMVVARNDILEMRQGLADGRFGVVIQIHDGTFTYVRLALADLDGANGLDIVVGDTVGNVIRFLNQGNGVFGAPVTRSSSTSIDDIVIFDVDRDGQVDAVTCGSSNGLYFWRNQGGGTFAAATVIAGTAGASFDDLLAEDLDGDGWRDLAALVSNTGALFLLRNNPSGLIVQPQLTVRPSSNSSRQDLMVAADLDDDGLRELAVVSNAILATPANVVQVLANLGSWQFGAATTLPISVPFIEQFRSIAAADFNLDNRTDLAVAGRSGILLLERTGVRTFTTREHCRAAGAVEDLLCVDVDDDQRPDLVLSIQDRLSGFKEAIQVVLHRR